MRRDPAFMQYCLRELSTGVQQAIQKQYRVYCLSAKPNSALMWAHYAASHQGVCLEFKTNDVVMCSALSVAYSKKYPPLTAATEHVPAELLAFHVKAWDWQYEQEYRLVSEEAAHAHSPHTLKTTNGFLFLPQGCLKAIIVGAAVSPTNVDRLRNIIKRSRRNVALRRALIPPNRYEIKIEP